MSGITPEEECITAYNTFKLQNSRKGDRFSALVFRIDTDEKIKIVSKQPQTGDNEKDWETFVEFIAPASKPENELQPSYAVFDFQIEHNEKKLAKILFVSFVPDYGNVRLKMLYGSTKEAFKSELGSGIAFDVQANSLDVLDYENICKTVTKLR